MARCGLNGTLNDLPRQGDDEDALLIEHVAAEHRVHTVIPHLTDKATIHKINMTLRSIKVEWCAPLLRNDDFDVPLY